MSGVHTHPLSRSWPLLWPCRQGVLLWVGVNGPVRALHTGGKVPKAHKTTDACILLIYSFIFTLQGLRWNYYYTNTLEFFLTLSERSGLSCVAVRACVRFRATWLRRVLKTGLGSSPPKRRRLLLLAERLARAQRDGQMLSPSLSFASSASGSELVLLARMKAPKS